MKNKFPFLVFSAAILFCGCFLGLGKQYSTISFKAETPAQRTVQRASRAVQYPMDVVFIDISADVPALQYQQFDPELNQIRVPKDGIYLIGMTYNASLDSRSISSGISMIGNVKIISNGLDSLPVSTTAEDEIDLGTLTQGENSFDSDLAASETAGNLGYNEETLDGFGNFDETILKFLNPDINRNGTYDTDEGIQWKFLVNYNIELTVTADGFDRGEIETPPRDIYPSVSWSFIHMGTLDSHADEFTYEGTNLNPDITLYFPEDAAITTDAGAPITSRNSYFVDENQVVFDMDPEGMNPFPPYSGDYKIDIYDKQYRLDDVRFVTPADDFENFLVLIFKQEYDQDGYVANFSWKWKIVENGQYTDPDPDLVKMRVKFLNVKWQYPGGEFHPQSGDGTEYYQDIEEYWLNGSLMPPSTVNAFGKMLSCTFEDAAGNSYVFSTQDSYVQAD